MKAREASKSALRLREVFLMAMDGLVGMGGVLRILFDLAVVLGLRVAADDEKREAGERRGEEDDGEEELGAQAEIAGAVTQDVCDRAAGKEPGAELQVVRRAVWRVDYGKRGLVQMDQKYCFQSTWSNQ